jgi:hypothetical protein
MVLPAETKIIKKTKALQNKWRKKGSRDRDLKKYNKWLDSHIRDTYNHDLGQGLGE